MKICPALLIVGALVIWPGKSWAVNDVGGTLITLTNTPTAPNGAWSWFQDERAIIDDSDPQNTLLLVSSVSGGTGVERGDVDLLWLNIDTGAQGEFELHDQLELDDHDSAALLIRPDGRYVASYGRHAADQFLRWRVSTNPHDPTSWTDSQSIDGSPTGTATATYSNLHYLPDDNGANGRAYNFSRTVDFNPNVLTSDDLGDTWEYRGKLLTVGTGNTRPYVRYFSDSDKIHFITTDGHPRDVNNSICHGYVKDGQLFNSNGVLVDANLFDGNGVSTAALTTVFAANTVVDGNTMTRAWTVDVAIDPAGDPVAVFQARIDDLGTLSGGQESREHLFFYARYDSVANAWTTHTLAAAGRDIYAASPNGSEDDYTGLVSIDPNDTSTLYMSANIDPRTGIQMNNYEIFRGHTPDGGATWHWDPITFNSTMKNVRPLVPKWSADETALIWMRGTYDTYQSFSPEVVVLTDITPLNLSTNGDFDGNNQIDAADYSFLLRNLNRTFFDLSPAETLELGDLNGDLATDFYDLAAFRTIFDVFNGAGSFVEMSTQVPEPDSMVLSGLVFAAAFRSVSTQRSNVVAGRRKCAP